MKPLLLTLAAGCLLSSSIFAVSDEPDPRRRSQTVVIANRGSGDISVIDARTDQVIQTVSLPAGTATPEPMYVVHSRRYDRVFVGDRANNRIVAFDDQNFTVDGTADAGAGVFHMWEDYFSRQLWVVNDLDNTCSVIDPGTLATIATVDIPADLVAQGGKPHDVILSPYGFFAYVSIVGVAGANDYVVQYETSNFQELNRAAVGKDPHLSLTWRNFLLYVPTQNADEVAVFSRFDLSPVTTVSVPGAHGAGMMNRGRYFYTTNLPGGGPMGLYAIDTRTNQLAGSPVDTPHMVPHNIALTRNDRKLYVTHSGATADKVSVYRVGRQSPEPVFLGEITVGLNPFGLAAVP